MVVEAFATINNMQEVGGVKAQIGGLFGLSNL
jgi:hypothetical protein